MKISQKMVTLMGMSILVGSTTGCVKSSDPKPADKVTATAVQPQAPLFEDNLRTIQLSTYYSNGRRLRAVNADGRVILEGELIDEGAQTYSSGGIIAFTVRGERGHFRLKAFNLMGQEIPTSQFYFHRNSEVFISDNIIAFTSFEQGKRLIAFNRSGKELNTSQYVLRDSGNGSSQVYISSNLIAFTTDSEGLRLHTFTARGQELRTSSRPLSETSKVYISKNLIAFTSDVYVPQNDNNPHALPQITGGVRLFTFTVDGKELRTSSQVLNENIEVSIFDDSIVLGRRGHRAHHWNHENDRNHALPYDDGREHPGDLRFHRND